MSTAFIESEEGVNPLGDDEQASSALPTVAIEPTWYSVDPTSSTQFAPVQASGEFGSAQNSSSTPLERKKISASSPHRSSISRGAGIKGRKGSSARLLVILGILVLLLLAGSVSVFASAAPNLFANHTGSHSNQVQQSVMTIGTKQKNTKSVLPPTPAPKMNVPPTPTPGIGGQTWFTGTLPVSCSAVGLKQDQSANANLEAVQFTLREESISFRNMNGLQSATALMTPQAKALRFINDRRSTKAFAQKVLNQQLIQAPENLQPVLKQCQQQGGQTFAWIVVTFERVTQCTTNDQGQPCLPNPNFVPEMNQQNQPLMHSMAVIMVAVPSGQANSPLWLGWSIVDYMLDQVPMLPTLPPSGQV